VAQAEMLRTFNCGIGMIVVVAASEAAAVEATFASAGETVARLGTLVPNTTDERVRFSGRLDLAR
jgi:phosphoribosylformylglycinamidine cyclo-ligase